VGEKRNAYRSLIGWNPERKKLLERSKFKWQGNIKTLKNRIEGVKLHSIALVLVNISCTIKCEECLD
jgi:hypothetical protein